MSTKKQLKLVRAIRNEPGTDLAPVEKRELEPDSDESIARIEAAQDRLPALVQAKDAETIKQWRDKGNAAALAAKRLGYKREALALERHSVRCTACLGELSANGDYDEFTKGTRGVARALGAARHRGHLEQVLDACGERVSETAAAAFVGRFGYKNVAGPSVVAIVRSHLAGRTVSQMAEEAGIDRQQVYKLTTRPRRTSGYWSTRAILLKLGIADDRIRQLPPGNKRTKRLYTNVKWITHRFRPGRGRHDEVEVRRVKLMVQLNHVNPSWVHVPGLYEALKTISDYTRREIVREERDAKGASHER